MNLEIANAISGYIETLYDTNKKLISICGQDLILQILMKFMQVIY